MRLRSVILLFVANILWAYSPPMKGVVRYIYTQEKLEDNWKKCRAVWEFHPDYLEVILDDEVRTYQIVEYHALSKQEGVYTVKLDDKLIDVIADFKHNTVAFSEVE